VTILVLFRRQFAAILDKIRAISLGDAKLELSEKLDKIENASRNVEVEGTSQDVNDRLPDDRFRSLVEISPSAAMIDAWAKIEIQLKSIAKRRGYDQHTSGSPYRTMSRLKNDGAITGSVFEILRDLRGMRNAVAHNQQASAVDAFRFWDLAQLATANLEKL
jgi:uncharacterized protein YutE (UPF0331/DUF86 family)